MRQRTVKLFIELKLITVKAIVDVFSCKFLAACWIFKWDIKYEKYKTDALSLWHQQQSTTVDIHGPLQTRGETRCPAGVSVSWLASRTRHECPNWGH